MQKLWFSAVPTRRLPPVRWLVRKSGHKLPFPAAGRLSAPGMKEINVSKLINQLKGGLSSIIAVFLLSFCTAPLGGAETILSLNFNGERVGADVGSVPDSIAGRLAVPSPNNEVVPQYAVVPTGGVGVKVGTNSILEVADSSGLGAGYKELCVGFDVDLASDVTAGTHVFLRNGQYAVPFNIFLLANNVIGVILQNSDGTFSRAVVTSGRALSAAAGWQSVAVVWKDSAVSIYVDGVAQSLNVGGTAAEEPGITTLIAPDAPLGIGGIRRIDGSTGQYLDAALDNIIIYSKAPTFR